MGSMFPIFLLCCVALVAGGQAEDPGHEDSRPLLAIQYGKLLGKAVTVKGTERRVHTFLGIPFAKPPVGKLRFALPQRPEPWSSIRDASQVPPVCLQSLAWLEQSAEQLNMEIPRPRNEEDCLILNIFTPADRGENAQLSVMVFIHGGGLMVGGASMLDGSALSAYENLVVVSVQYRLGFLGFLSGDSKAPGNLGLLDQVAALQWVQENIKDFGGDPRSVTIFGESAGGFSVAAHILSPLSKGLFHRAIAESGTAILPGLMITDSRTQESFKKSVADLSGCDPAELVDCLKAKTKEELLGIYNTMKFQPMPGCVDGEFLLKPPEEILVNKEVNRVPLMIGVTDQEFGWLLPNLFNLVELSGIIDKQSALSALRNPPLSLILHETHPDAIPAIFEEYIGDMRDPSEIRSRFQDLCGDVMFVIPALKTAKYHRDSGLPVYFYEFQRRPSMFNSSKPGYVKADHTDELFFVMGGPFINATSLFNGYATEEEEILSRTVMNYWANFARSGDPNGPDVADWPEFREDENYLQINLEQKAAKGLKQGKFEFFTKILPEKTQKMREKAELYLLTRQPHLTSSWHATIVDIVINRRCINLFRAILTSARFLTQMGFLIQILLLCWAAAQGTAEDPVQEDSRPLLDTNNGKLLGRTMSVMGTERRVHAFLGVPFAKPPVGELRFASPQPPEPWSSIRDASKQPAICLQPATSLEMLSDFFKREIIIPPVSEDCLLLNLFTPADRRQDSKLPVLVFIHGGGLSMGGAFLFDGSAISAYEDVVMVAIQYRLGVLGFFSTGDKEAPGNFGLLDQVAALQWVQENIKDFGGDPQSVTICGESAGALSVAALVLSPLSKGLFHRAIAESGTAMLPGLVANTPEEVHFLRNTVANISGCDSAVVFKCLKEKTENEMIDLLKALEFVPLPMCVDGVFLPKPSEEILANKENNRVPLMIGVCEQEFGWAIPLVMNISGITEGMTKDTVEATLRLVPFLSHTTHFIPLAMEEYFGDTSDPTEIRDRFLDLCGDLAFVIPALKTAKYHRDSGLPVYFYEFQHRPSVFKDFKPDYVKADHGDELLFVLGSPFWAENNLFNGQATDEEKHLSRTVMKYWANFVRNGDPNGPGLTKWTEYSKDESYLQINLEPTPAQRLKDNRLQFWTKTFPEKIQKLSETDHSEL
ncbi:uncharacterized protein LOC128468037 [Spea bombifrons]|uniref:uncharacterized protein LOC128468037 n=1 Tax=Spea bombifrons TaxID=233779 RepID=UPI0023495550|nr:uncharacterized protein LOC128468037 [Spea bombifrons]